MPFNNNYIEKQRIKNIHIMPTKLLKKPAITEGYLSLFGVCKIGLVSCIEYERNIQTLIINFELNMRQHDLFTHDSITARPL